MLAARITLIACLSPFLASAIQAQHPTLAHATAECRAAGPAVRLASQSRGESPTAIAIYPLASPSSAEEIAYLSDAIPRAVAERLAALGDVDVAYFSEHVYSPNAISSPAFWPSSAQASRYALVGRLERQRGRASVQITLHGGEKNEPLWSERFALGAVPWQEVVGQVSSTVAARIARPSTEALHRLAAPLASSPDRELVARATYLAQDGSVGAARAVPLYVEALERAPSNVEAHVGLVRALATVGRSSPRLLGISADSAAALALRSSSRATNAASNDPRAWVARAEARALADPVGYNGVVAAYRQAISLDQGHADARFGLALAYRDLGQDAASNAEFRRAVAAAPWRVDIAVAYARSLMLQRQFRTACGLLNGAISADPEHGPAYTERSMVRVRLGEWREAIADAATAMRTGDMVGGTVASVIARAAARDTTAAITELVRLTALIREESRDDASVLLALAQASAGRAEEALDLLSSNPVRGLDTAALLRHYGFDSIRGNRRFVRSARSSASPQPRRE